MIEKIEIKEEIYSTRSLLKKVIANFNELVDTVNELSLKNDYADSDKQDTSKDYLKKETLDFSEALKKMKEGKFFKRTIWTNAAKIYLEDGKFKIKFEGTMGDSYLFLYNHLDILANDWVEC